MPVVEATPDQIAKAGQLIRDGALVAFPTETVYGLGADATNGEAVARIFAAKGRPSFNPLIVHVPDLAGAERLAHLTPHGRKLAAAFWPGPLTLVMQRRTDAPIADLATAGLPTLAVRVPSHPVAQALLAASGRPVAAPSANRSGHVSPTLAQHVKEDLGNRVDLILDAGAAALGLESTVIDVSGETAVLLRPGGIPAEAIEAVLGTTLSAPVNNPEAPTAPGMLASHYAPTARLRLNATAALDNEALLAFGPAAPSRRMVINLSPAGDLTEAAAHLFAALRAFDAAGYDAVAVMPVPGEGLGRAINDRLRRAAAPRA